MDALRDLFPDIDSGLLKGVLESCKNNLQTAVDTILSMGGSQSSDATPESVPQPQPKPQQNIPKKPDTNSKEYINERFTVIQESTQKILTEIQSLVRI